MKKINENSYIFIDFDGVILDTEMRLEFMKGERTWEEFSPTVDWTKLIKEAEEIESSIENLKQIEKTYKHVFVLSKVHTIHEMKEKLGFLRNNNINIPVHFVPYSSNKSDVVIPKNNYYLIDDQEVNVVDWNQKGGVGIHFSELKKDNSISSLKELIIKGEK